MYDEQIAKHYAAYRPPLHAIILQKALGEFDKKRLGLDIGCGTGCSTRALKHYCESVIGIEPSLAMISQAESQAGIEYINASAEDLPLHENEVDIVTLAGSLHYIDRDRLVRELKRVCKAAAIVIVYDFKIDLSTIEETLALEVPQLASGYDHSINLHGYAGLTEISVIEDQLPLDLTATQAAHLMLATNSRYQTLQKKYEDSDPFDSLEHEISEKLPSGPRVQAKIYYSIYEF